MTIERILLALGVILLTALSLFVFPGRTILQSDTQIYLPILERLNDPALYANDLMATRPHVSFTVYDEVAIALRRLTGAPFETILQSQQALYRALGITGLLLLALALGFSSAESFLIAALTSLGTTIFGPSVLTVEYEPVPRGFSLPFLLLAMGLLAHNRWNWAALSVSIGFLFHPPTALPVIALLFLAAAAGRRWKTAGILLGGATAISILAILQAGNTEHGPLFARIPPELEKLQRLRGSYSWVSVWIGRLWPHWVIISILGAAGYWRIRDVVPARMKLLFAGLPLIGILSLPLSYLLLEQAKWSLIPQLQPGRYLLYTTLFAVFFAGCAGVKAAVARRLPEAFAFLFLMLPAAFPSTIDHVLRPPSDIASNWPKIALLILYPALAALSCRWRHPALIAASAILPIPLMPVAGKAVNYPPAHHSELNQLAAWARSETPKDAVFQFADAGRQQHPGIFRARSLRAIYVDYKAGGQVNFLPEFADEWWTRWQQMEEPRTVPEYAAFGIDYVVYFAANRQPGLQPVFENGRYAVYGTGNSP